MLSYQHKYHVGNHADVLKHLCWLSVIEYLNQKNKPYTLIDTHAGEGLYSLGDIDNDEQLSGVSKLANIAPEQGVVSSYQRIIAHYTDHKQLPGSPAVASALMRESDVLHCIELHPQAWEQLRGFANGDKNTIHCHKRDAFEGLRGLVPPRVKRGAVLIDPPYEQIEEYQQVFESVTDTLARWPNAQLLIWIPLLGQRAPKKANAANKLISRLQSLDTETTTVKLTIADKQDLPGMYGSVVLVVNPYWTFSQQLSEALPEIAARLGEQCQWTIER